MAVTGGAAWAADAKPRLAVVSFTGPQAKQAEAVVVRTLRKKATLIPSTSWDKSAKKLFARTHSAEDIAAVADDVGAKIVVTGILKRDGRNWQLSVSVRDGKTGKPHDRLHYPVKGTRPRLTAATLALLAKEVEEAWDGMVAPAAEAKEELTPVPELKTRDKAVSRPAPAPAPTPTPGQSGAAAPPPPGKQTVAEAGREEAPPGVEPPPPPPPTEQVNLVAPTRRPRWAPYFDLEAGGSISGRSFDYDPASQPKFSSGVVAGVHADLTLYPLASTWNKARGLFAGLGLGGSVDVPFWPASTSKQDPNARYPTSELKVEGGLRWRIVMYKPLPRPSLLLAVGGGLHNFTIGKDNTTTPPSDVGPADVSYKYVTAGGGMRIYFAEWAWLWAMFDYHVVLAAGPVTDGSEYGPARTYGLRVRGGLDFLVYKGLKIAASGFYERFTLKFAGTGNPAKAANSGTDQYFGGFLAIGYVL